MSRTASPRAPTVSASASALSLKVSVTLSPRSMMVSVIFAPVCSSFDTTSLPRRLEIEHDRVAGRLEGAVDLVGARRDGLGELARRLDDRLGERVRARLHHVDDRGGLLREAVGDPVEPRRHHLLHVGRDLDELLVEVIGLEVEARGEPVARRLDRVRWSRGWCARAGRAGRRRARRARRSSNSPAWPSATVMCSPFSASARAMRWAASLTRSATASLTEVMSCERSRWTLVMALRTCSAWPTRVSRCEASPSSRVRMRSSLSL